MKKYAMVKNVNILNLVGVNKKNYNIKIEQ